MVERCVRDAEAAGSNPVIPTIRKKTAVAIKRPEGTFDLFGQEMQEWELFKKCANETFGAAAYELIQTPTFEKTELFVRGIGDTTDVVNKEMYSALSGGNIEKLKSGEEISSKAQLTLRPEGTAGAVRAAVENGWIDQASQPVRIWYAGPMFRAERPQKGRQRQFHQIGIECLGSNDASLDAQAIVLMMQLFKEFGIDVDKCTLHLNSLGCEKCRPAYREAVKKFIHTNTDCMCETCMERAEKNPLRSFDCKNPECKSAMQNAPLIDQYLCDDCKAHFAKVKQFLDLANCKYEIDATLVRGLDYYTKTVFECTFNDGLGAQNAIGGGGRYDKLAAEIGGPDIPGLGFAVGFERCLLAKKASASKSFATKRKGLFIIPLDENAKSFAEKMFVLNSFNPEIKLDMDLRPEETGQTCVRSLKSQLKLANKSNAETALILGSDEMENKCFTVRNLETHEDSKVSFDDAKKALHTSIPQE